jgi:pyruvate kinase
MERVKIICTIGPVSEKPDVLEKIIIGGMDVARMNFSHCTHDEFKKRKALIAKFNAKHGKNVKIMQDLQGPRIRVGIVPEEGVKLNEGEEILFSTDKENRRAVFIDSPLLHRDIKTGETIYLSNGDIKVAVVEKNGKNIKGKVMRGGILYSRKGINLPDTDLKVASITEKDFKDIDFVLSEGVDYIALSFIKSAKDIVRLREYIKNRDIKIIAKIERKQAITNLDEIIDAADAIMIARGDLGIELPIADVPIIQKDVITRAKIKRKPTIVATQMLMSMVNHPFPTRAEISDIANAVLDGASSLMLSDETAFGRYPVEALEFLARTAKRAEEFQYGELLE